MRFGDIPQFPRSAWYADVSLDYVEQMLDGWKTKVAPMSSVELCPDFQRGHVWTKKQRVAFMEYMLRDGPSGRDVYFNHPNWMGSFEGDFVLVDGLQRLSAALAFLSDDLPAFGARYSEYDRVGLHIGFRFHVATLQTRAEVLQWYVDFNEGGTPHTVEEMDRVRDLLVAEDD